jgi:phosphatidylserine/phosphatidylglycerophosphate/cardiolipin synthase-like enzyme
MLVKKRTCVLLGMLLLPMTSCRSRTFQATGELESTSYQCERGVRLIDFMGRSQSCYKLDAVEKDSVLSVGTERKLTPFIPCNRVKHISEASDAQHNNTAYIEWLKQAPPLSTAALDAMFTNPTAQPREFASHPLLHTPSHNAILSLIRNAKHTIFLDVMLFGGVWGAEIVREMLVANRERGVEIVFVRDNKNLFWFKAEIEPVWSRMIRAGARTPGVLALRSDMTSRRGDFPFMVDVFNQLGGAPKAMGGDLAGTSDHSKVLIVDGFNEHAAAYVTSKNFSDFNYINYDEGVVIHGPAAGMLQVNYVDDLEMAVALARKERPSNGEPALTTDNLQMFERWKGLKARVTHAGEGEVRYPAKGTARVRILENNASNSVHNIEHGVYTLVASAKKSIRLYNFLAYNPMFAKALVDAEKRLGEGNVRMLLDTADSYPGNQIQYYGLKKLRSPSFKSPLSTLARWRKLVGFISRNDVLGGVDIGQEQHVKSIIVDDKYYLAGSANFDILTFGGSFRETSVVVEDTETSRKASEIFDSIWNNPAQLTTSEALAKDFPETTFTDKMNEFMFTGMADEQRRVRSLNPLNIVPDPKCMR